MFEAYRDELTTPRAQRPVPIQEPIVELSSLPMREQTTRSYSDNKADYMEIPIEEFGAYLKERDQSVAAQLSQRATSSVQEMPSATAMPSVDLQGILGLVGSLLSTGGSTGHPIAAAGSENFQATILPAVVETQQLVMTAPVKPRGLGGMSKKTAELIGNQPPRRRIATVGSVAVIAALAFGSQYNRDSTDQTHVLLTAPASLINQGAVIASIDMQSRATVRIPVTGFPKPLLFMEKNKPVEPAATLNDTISITLAPQMDKKGNSLPIATIIHGDTFEVDRSTIDVKATFDNYLGLNIDCVKQATAKYRYCVAGSPVKLHAKGKLSVKTANQLNQLLTTQGSNFDTYYQGVKAKLAVASLAKVEQDACGTEIFGLADEVIKSLLQKQSATAKVQFTPNSHYPSTSQDYAANFTSLVNNKAFSIEQGDSKNAIANSLQVTCKVNLPITKGVNK